MQTPSREWAQSVGLTPVSAGPAVSAGPVRLNTALPTMLASVLQQGGISAPATTGTPASAVMARAPQPATLAPYSSSPPIGGYADGGAVLPASNMDGGTFYRAAQRAGLPTDNNTLNRIVDAVNRGMTVEAAVQQLAQGPQGIRGYADGGAIPVPGMSPGPQLGAPPAPGGIQGQPPQTPAKQVDPQAFQAELSRFMRNHPQQVKQIQEVVQSALQSGELSMEELNLAVQLAVAAAQNPQMYPKLRQLAIQKGLGGEDDIPPQYDQSLVFALIIAGQALSASAGGMGQQGGMSPAQPQGPTQQLRDGGGVIPRNKNPSDDAAEGRRDDVKIAVSGGEYVIPAHIVRQKGTDFFDKMIGKDVPGRA